MRKLEFTGAVQASETPPLTLPGRDDLFLKPDDWPTQIARTVTVEVGTFQEGLTEIGEGKGCQSSIRANSGQSW